MRLSRWRMHFLRIFSPPVVNQEILGKCCWGLLIYFCFPGATIGWLVFRWPPWSKLRDKLFQTQALTIVLQKIWRFMSPSHLTNSFANRGCRRLRVSNQKKSSQGDLWRVAGFVETLTKCLGVNYAQSKYLLCFGIGMENGNQKIAFEILA